ncbi:MAG: hypothetical protein ACXWR4_14310, partial [Bdellovibrionota bacterium]
MKNLILVLSLVSVSGFAAEIAPKAGAHLIIELPGNWDDDTKTLHDAEFIVVNEANSIETCTYRGGAITVTKVAGGKVFFDPSPKPSGGRCAHLVATVENFHDWNPTVVHERKAAFEAKQAKFKAQLKEDVTSIVEKGADPCARQDSELKTGNVYKVQGRVFLYGPGTAATSVDGNSCQVEAGGMVEILGFNRASDFAVAVYHRQADSGGFVPVGPAHTKTEVCKSDSRVVFSLSKLKRHFSFGKPSTVENLQAKGIAAVFNSRPKVCANDTNDSNVSFSHSRKGGAPSGGVGRDVAE